MLNARGWQAPEMAQECQEGPARQVILDQEQNPEKESMCLMNIFYMTMVSEQEAYGGHQHATKQSQR